MKNQVQLITYADRLGQGNIESLRQLLTTQFDGLFAGVHVLPFYFPIDGSDAGFDPIDHLGVDDRLGDWHDIGRLGQQQPLLADLIVNHVSADSEPFKDVLANGENSPWWPLFLTKDKVYPNGLTEAEEAQIYHPGIGRCFTEYTLADDSKHQFWTTFTSNQLDIDVTSSVGQQYLTSILDRFAENNIAMARLDAAGHAVKKAGTCCFMLDETFEFINQLTQQANQRGISTLVEVHSHYQTQIEIAKRVDRVYDFALPPLVLHTIFSQDSTALGNWLKISPRNCITVLDTHDGIGIIDAGPMNGLPGLLTQQQTDNVVATIHSNSKGQSLQATGEAASNVDKYQVNCTFYDALAQNDYDYLLARTIQLFAPGLPQIYYAGLLAQANDMSLLVRTNVGRDINRPYLDEGQIAAALTQLVVKVLIQLIKLRNSSAAFDGEFSIETKQHQLDMSWQNGIASARLAVDLKCKTTVIHLSDGQQRRTYSLAEMLISNFAPVAPDKAQSRHVSHWQ